MLNMENAEEVMQILERFTRLKQKEIPKELDDYMHYVAKTGDTVFKWSSLKYLFREKLLNVIKNFHDTSPRVDDLPQYPNVDPFNYESMKSSLLERLELFNAAPFTVQRLCELLTEPRKQYSRIDKFMRALEKNILVSTIEPGRKRTESENGDSLDSVVNGDVSLDVNVDIEMENDTIFNAAETPSNSTPSETPVQPSSNLIHKSDDDILPNPKKPKLDLDETNDAETEAATKSIISNKPEPTIPSVEVSMAEEATEITPETEQDKKSSTEEKSNASEEKPVSQEVVGELSKKDNKENEPEKMEEDPPSAATPEETKTHDKAETEESEKKIVEKEVTSAPVVAVMAATDEKILESKPTEVVIKAADKTDKSEEKQDCSQEEVIEKIKNAAESEKVAKEDKSDKEALNGHENKLSEEKTEPTITTTDKTNGKQSESAGEETVAPISQEKPEESSEGKKAKTVESTISTDAVEKQENIAAAATPEVVAASAEEVTKVKDVKAAVVVAAAAEEQERSEKSAEEVVKGETAAPAKPTLESQQAEPIAKTDEVKPTELKEKETEKPTTVAEKAVPLPSVDAPAAAATTETKEADTQAVADVAPVAEKSEAITKNVEQAAPADDATPQVVEAAIAKETVSPAIVDTSAAAPPAESATGVTAPSTTTTPAEAVKDVTIPAVVEEPAVTADQPMDENPESIAEAEPVVPAIVVEAAAAVEEVVMGDSAEMATDAIEPAKDEPAGMEVDDTSQPEAMDQ